MLYAGELRMRRSWLAFSTALMGLLTERKTTRVWGGQAMANYLTEALVLAELGGLRWWWMYG